MRRSLVVGFAVLAVCVLPSVILAAWIPDGSPVSTAANAQSSPAITPDGFGGVIIAWEDYRSGTDRDIYAQRMDAGGTALWATNGVAISTDLLDQLAPAIIGDGAGGAIITWHDQSDSTFDIYAQKIDVFGVVQWSTNGIPVSAAVDNQLSPVIVTDGFGGAIIVWEDYRAGTNANVYGQRVDASGAVLWTPDGAPISIASDDQLAPQIAPTDQSGVIVTWQDYQGGMDADIYAQKLDALGNALWTSSGVPITLATDDQLSPAITSDGQNGAIITWYDYQSGTSLDIYSQRVDALGNVQWVSNGISLSSTTNIQLSPRIVSDNQGGAIVTWYEYLTGADYDIYTQRVDSLGNLLWTSSAVAMTTAIDLQFSPEVVTDDNEGAIVTWVDYRSGFNFDIYAQRVDDAGTVLWAADGDLVSAAVEDQTRSAIAPDGHGSAIVTWKDDRSGLSADVYAQRAGASVVGANNVSAAGSLRLSNRPNPFLGTTEVAFHLSEPSRVEFEIVVLAGKLIYKRVWPKLPGGPQAISFRGRDREGRELATGIYLYRISATGLTTGARVSEVRKMVRLR